MNLKAIQRDYGQLTMLERLSVADQAIARDDEGEVKAIIAASPRVHYSQPDYVELFENINRARFCNLITRLNYVMMFDAFGLVEEGKVTDHMRFAAYLYVRATDSWSAICDEFVLCPEFGEKICQHLFAVEMLETQDHLLREFAFTESEAQAYTTKAGGGQIQTLADEIKAMREVLGLPPS